MPSDPKPHRRSIRLPNYDYAQPGAYFVTLVTSGREPLFGHIDTTGMHLNANGDVATACWQDLVDHYPNLSLDEFVVMPNHVHGLLFLTDPGRAGYKPAPTERYALPEIVRGFKTFSARRVNELRGTQGIAVWQRNYYEHVVRDDAELDRVREYIRNNPAQWSLDKYNPAHQ